MYQLLLGNFRSYMLCNDTPYTNVLTRLKPKSLTSIAFLIPASKHHHMFLLLNY